MRVLCAGSNVWKIFGETEALQMDTFTELAYANLVDMQMQPHCLILISSLSEGREPKVKIEVVGRVRKQLTRHQLHFRDEHIVQVVPAFEQVYFLSATGDIWFIDKGDEYFELQKVPDFVGQVEVIEPTDTEANAAAAEPQRTTTFVTDKVISSADGHGVLYSYTQYGFIYRRKDKLATRLANVKDMICGSFFCLLLTSSGDIYSFGQNHHGQLGHGDLETRKEPALIQALAGIQIVKIACGQAHCAALSRDGDLYLWGSNFMGELGQLTAKNGGISLMATPTPVDFNVNVSDVVCGSRSTLVLLDNMKLFGCGNNEFRQLGVPSEMDTIEEMTLLKDLTGETVVGLRASSLNTAILLADK